jgi:predicted dehydrogenase
MALTKQEVESITQAAKDNNVIVMEGFMYVFHPQFDFVLNFINSGKLGKTQYAHSMFSFPIQPARYYRINRSMQDGGGALWDIGPYAIHTLRQVMGGHIKQLNASAKLNSHQADMSTSGILEFTDQRRATFDISFECTRRSEFEVFGEKGRLKCHTVWQHENDEAIISYELDGSDPVIEKNSKGKPF